MRDTQSHSNANLSGPSFNGCDLAGCKLRISYFIVESFIKAILDKPYLMFSSFTGPDFTAIRGSERYELEICRCDFREKRTCRMQI